MQYQDLVRTSWEKTLAMRVERRLQDLGKAQHQSYQESDIDSMLELSRLHTFAKNYAVAVDVLVSTNLGSKTCRLTEITAQIGILQGNYPLTLAQEKKIESFLSGCKNHEIYADRLIEEEITYYFRVKFLMIYAEFLKKNFEGVIESMHKLLEVSITSHAGVTYTWLDVFNSSKKFGKFINQEEILRAYVISLLITCPVKNLKTVANSDTFTTIVGKDSSSYYKPLFLSLSTADFKELFHLLQEKFESFATTNVFFNKVWNSIKLHLRYKAYGLYLSLIVRINASHLSDRLDIDKTTLIKELKGYIKDKELEFDYKEQGEIFEKIEIDKHQVFLNKLTAATEEIDAIETNLKDHSNLLQRRIAPKNQAGCN